MVITGEKPIVITQKNMIKKSKHTDTKRPQNTKKSRRIRNKEQWIYKTARKQLTKWQ